MIFTKGHGDPVYPVNSCFTQMNDDLKYFVCYNFPWGCTEFPENSVSFPCSEKSLSIPGFPGLWPPCTKILLAGRHCRHRGWGAETLGHLPCSTLHDGLGTMTTTRRNWIYQLISKRMSTNKQINQSINRNWPCALRWTSWLDSSSCRASVNRS